MDPIPCRSCATRLQLTRLRQVVPLLKESMLGDRAAPGMGRVAVAHYREVLETVGRGSVVSDVYRASMHDRVGALWAAYNDTADGASAGALAAWTKGFFDQAVELAQRDLGTAISFPAP